MPSKMASWHLAILPAPFLNVQRDFSETQFGGVTGSTKKNYNISSMKSACPLFSWQGKCLWRTALFHHHGESGFPMPRAEGDTTPRTGNPTLPIVSVLCNQVATPVGSDQPNNQQPSSAGTRVTHPSPPSFLEVQSCSCYEKRCETYGHVPYTRQILTSLRTHPEVN